LRNEEAKILLGPTTCAEITLISFGKPEGRIYFRHIYVDGIILKWFIKKHNVSMHWIRRIRDTFQSQGFLNTKINLIIPQEARNSLSN
jgi:hypothetical protein